MQYLYSRAMSSKLAENARPFVPYPVTSAIYTESLAHMAELRRVTTVFMKLDSFSTKIYGDPIQLQPYFRFSSSSFSFTFLLPHTCR